MAICWMFFKYELSSMKRGFKCICVKTNVPDQPVQSTQADQGRHFPLLLYFLCKELLIIKIQFWLKVSSLISLCGSTMLLKYLKTINPNTTWAETVVEKQKGKGKKGSGQNSHFM